MTGSTLGATTTAYGWDAATNRTSVQVGAGTPATTAYDNANRPSSGANPTAAYTSDDDGRLTARPGQQLVWDRLGRLTQVKNSGGTVLATYTYDPLDRLRMIDYGGGTRIRFRYVGLTTTVAQWIDDAAGTVTRSVGTGWSGERLLDWTGANSNVRVYGENAHHDVTWLASDTGTVSQALRYDPWGNPRATVPTGYSPFRFQGSYYDATTDLSWVVTRWYAPSLGSFVSEDELSGEPANPGSRQLYAYGQGEPVGRWDLDGRFWYRWQQGDTYRSVAASAAGLRNPTRAQAIYNTNRNRLGPLPSRFPPGRCVWVPRDVWYPDLPNECRPLRPGITGDIKNDPDTKNAARVFLGSWRSWYLLDRTRLNELTRLSTGRSYTPGSRTGDYRSDEDFGSSWAYWYGFAHGVGKTRRWFPAASMWLVKGSWLPPSGNAASTFGRYVFLGETVSWSDIECCGLALLSHEYIHMLQWQANGSKFAASYIRQFRTSTGPSNPLEAPGYVWQAWIKHYSQFGEAPPWHTFKPLPA